MGVAARFAVMVRFRFGISNLSYPFNNIVNANKKELKQIKKFVGRVDAG